MLFSGQQVRRRSLVVVVLNLAIATMIGVHLLIDFHAEQLLARNLATPSNFSYLIRREWHGLVKPVSFIALFVVGALLELKRSSAATLLNPLIPVVSIVIFAFQIFHYSVPSDARGETGTVLVLIGLPMFLMAILYSALYWRRLQFLLVPKRSSK